MSTEVLERHLAFQGRITQAKERLARAEQCCQTLVFGNSTLADVDPDGHLGRAIRGLLPLAAKTPHFKVTLMIERTTQWAVRVQNEDGDVTVSAVCLQDQPARADLVPGQPRHRAGQELMTLSVDAVNELAGLLGD